MKIIDSTIRQTIDRVKETSWSSILLFSILYSIQVSFINLVVFKYNLLRPVAQLTLGLIDETLLVNFISITIFIYIIILRHGKLDLSDIGFRNNNILSAVIACFAVWFTLQLLNVIVGFIISGKPIVYSGWGKYGVTRMVGSFIAQVFGNCLFEELAFRGFLLVQICKKLKGKVSILAGVIVSQLIFSLIHIPNRILNGISLSELLPSLIFVFLLGVLFAAIYLITDNLFLAIGIHALLNTPFLIFDGLRSMWVILISALILLLLWNKTFGKLSPKPSDSIRSDIVV